MEKMKRKQKRYTEEQQIIDDIQSAKDKAYDCLSRAMNCDRVVEVCYNAELQFKLDNANKDDALRLQMDIDSLKINADLKRTEAKRLSQRRNRLEQVRLPALKNSLAAFRTRLLSK